MATTGPQLAVLRRMCHCRLLLGALALLVLPACHTPHGELTAGSTRVSAVDGMSMVYVPAGTFHMGSDHSDIDAQDDEKPAHSVYLDAFWIDRTEVTQRMYARCVSAARCTAPMRTRRYGDPRYALHPVLGVTWFQGQEYCAWAGRRLPTEAEWEKAARGTNGRLYPWGNDSPDPNRLNIGGYIGDTTEVGRYPAGASPYGALDMAGNAWEWTADWYGGDYYTRSPADNPAGPASGTVRVLRGGAWGADGRAARAANRFWAFPGRDDLDGFRCASDP